MISVPAMLSVARGGNTGDRRRLDGRSGSRAMRTPPQAATGSLAARTTAVKGGADLRVLKDGRRRRRPQKAVPELRHDESGTGGSEGG